MPVLTDFQVLGSTSRTFRALSARAQSVPLRRPHLNVSYMQASLERVGLDASKAIARARSRSVSRVGRKRQRDASAGAGEAMEVDGSQAPEKKRIHSAKSRCHTCWQSILSLL